jgi:hypothetical protein
MLVGMGLASLLVLAWRLDPDPRGLGTHQQLGLPACTIRVLFGMRCPSCGMTTSWSHAVRGEWPSALACNVAGAILAAAAMVGVVWTLAAAVRGRWWLWRPSDGVLLFGAITVVVLALVDWGVRLAVGA